MNEKYVFETERLGFRRWRTADKIPFAAMNADSIVMNYFPNCLSKDESDGLIARFEQHFDEQGFGIWAVELKETEEFIGFIGLLTVNFEIGVENAVEIGWRLAREHWKKGYAVEGATGCLKYAFETLGLHEIYSFTAVVNEPSETVMQRIGMVKVKEFDHPKVAVGHPLQRHVLYRIEH